jgi:hypothetical protein
LTELQKPQVVSDVIGGCFIKRRICVCHELIRSIKVAKINDYYFYPRVTRASTMSPVT